MPAPNPSGASRPRPPRARTGVPDRVVGGRGKPQRAKPSGKPFDGRSYTKAASSDRRPSGQKDSSNGRKDGYKDRSAADHRSSARRSEAPIGRTAGATSRGAARDRSGARRPAGEERASPTGRPPRANRPGPVRRQDPPTPRSWGSVARRGARVLGEEPEV